MTEDHPFVLRARRAAAIQEICCIIVAGIICAIGAVGCPPTPPPNPPSAPDAGAGSCPLVCDHLRALSCPGGAPTPEGATCEQVCQTIQESGIVHWNLTCRAAASTCAAIDACDVDAQD